MAVTANSIVTAQGQRADGAILTAANTAYDTAANAQVIFTAGPNGSRVNRVTATARATVTATELQLFRDKDGSGAVKKFFKSKLMPAYTVTQTTQNTETDFGYTDANVLKLAPNEKLYGAIGVALAGGIVFNVEGEDL